MPGGAWSTRWYVGVADRETDEEGWRYNYGFPAHGEQVTTTLHRGRSPGPSLVVPPNDCDSLAVHPL